MTYIDKKAEVRQEAIDWQTTWENNNYSLGEIVVFQEHFEKLGKRYGLLKEFRENAIC